MPFSVEWDNAEQTIVRITFPAVFTWDEYYTANKQCATLCTQLDHDVYALMDMRALDKFPPNALAQFPKIAHALPPNLALMVIVGAKGFQVHIVKLFSRVYGQTRVTDTIERARAIIAEAQRA